jgi:lysophospholipase L1-like esterase
MTFWVPFLTHQQFVSPQSLNFGVSGQNSAQIAARVGDVIDSGAGVCVVLAGTNDIGGLTVAQTKTNLSAIYEALANANIMIIALPILPRTLSGEANYSFPQEVNEWIRQQGQNYAGFKFIDPFLFGDPYSVTYSPRTGYTYDGLHPMAIGMRYVSQPVADYLNSLVAAPTPQVRSVTDYFNASNPRGVLNPNPLLGGDSGTPPEVGDVADDYNISANAGGGDVSSLVVTASKDVSAAGMVNQKIVLGGSATGGFDTNVIFSIPVDEGNLNAGDQIELLADIEVAGGTVGVSGISAYVYANQSGVAKFAYDGYAVVSDDLTEDDFTGTFRTPAMTLTADPTVAEIGIKISLKNTGTTRSADVRINNMALRKIV